MPNLVPKLVANLPLVLLTIAMVVGAVWIHRVWHEAHGEDDDAGDTPEDLLQQFREAHAAGEMDDAEFARVRQLLTGAGTAAPQARSMRRRGDEVDAGTSAGDPPADAPEEAPGTPDIEPGSPPLDSAEPE